MELALILPLTILEVLNTAPPSTRTMLKLLIESTSSKSISNGRLIAGGGISLTLSTTESTIYFREKYNEIP